MPDSLPPTQIDASLAAPSNSLPAHLLDQVASHVAKGLSPNTRRVYEIQLRRFLAWCEEHGVSPLPATPETVAAHISDCVEEEAWGKNGKPLFDAEGMPVMKKRSVATLEQRVAAINWRHEMAGLESPTRSKGVQLVLKGIRRELGVKPDRKLAIGRDRLSVMVHATPDTLKGLRDKALLLLGWVSALRRSEIVALRVEDLREVNRGLLLNIAQSKTDQERSGRQVAVIFGQNDETCPVRAVKQWIEAAAIHTGRVFRSVNRHGHVGEKLSGRAVGAIVKLYAEEAGLDPKLIGGHSLRAGLVTELAERRARPDQIMAISGHRSAQMLTVYTRPSDLFHDSPTEGLL